MYPRGVRRFMDRSGWNKLQNIVRLAMSSCQLSPKHNPLSAKGAFWKQDRSANRPLAECATLGRTIYDGGGFRAIGGSRRSSDWFNEQWRKFLYIPS
jgi:hypothetical protein